MVEIYKEIAACLHTGIASLIKNEWSRADVWTWVNLKKHGIAYKEQITEDSILYVIHLNLKVGEE